MEKKSIKILKWLCYVALALVALWLAFMAIQSYFVLSTGSGEGVINWGSPSIGAKVAIFVGQRVAALTLGILCAVFVINILKCIKGGTIFSHANVVLLRVMAVVVPAYAFLSDNLGIACSAGDLGEFCLTDNPFVYTMIVLIVGQLYKLAHDAAKEQELTI